MSDDVNGGDDHAFLCMSYGYMRIWMEGCT